MFVKVDKIENGYKVTAFGYQASLKFEHCNISKTYTNCTRREAYNYFRKEFIY